MIILMVRVKKKKEKMKVSQCERSEEGEDDGSGDDIFIQNDACGKERRFAVLLCLLC